MRCNEKRRLLLSYRTSAALHSRSVTQLQTASRPAFNDILKLSADARHECRRAWLKLEMHVWLHGCWFLRGHLALARCPMPRYSDLRKRAGYAARFGFGRITPQRELDRDVGPEPSSICGKFLFA